MQQRFAILHRHLALVALTLAILPALPARVTSAAPIPSSIASHGQLDVRDTVTDGEIRQAAYADLTPTALTVSQTPGSTTRTVCAKIENIGSKNAGPFEVAFSIDGIVPPNGAVILNGVAAGSHAQACVQIVLPATGQHTLAVHPDAYGVIPESNKNNNYLAKSIVGTLPNDVSASTGDSPGAVTVPTPQPTLVLPTKTTPVVPTRPR